MVMVDGEDDNDNDGCVRRLGSSNSLINTSTNNDRDDWLGTREKPTSTYSAVREGAATGFLHNSYLALSTTSTALLCTYFLVDL
jgi:hypothetical protein